MTRPLNILTTALATLAVAVALFGLVNLGTTSAQAVAGAYTAPVYGSAMLDAGEEH